MKNCRLDNQVPSLISSVTLSACLCQDKGFIHWFLVLRGTVALFRHSLSLGQCHRCFSLETSSPSASVILPMGGVLPTSTCS